MQLRATSLRAIKNAALINALTLANIWSAGQPGLWYDASDRAALRVNLLTKSEQFDDSAIWQLSTGDSVASNTITDPLGGMTADAYTFGASTSSFAYLTQTISGDASPALEYFIWIKCVSGTLPVRLVISNITVATLSTAILTITTMWQKFSLPIIAGALANTSQIGVGFVGGTPGAVYHVWGAQLSAPSSAYQRVNTATDYDYINRATLFQDSAGTTPVTAVTQKAGLMLDKRLGLVSSNIELINNSGGPFTVTTGYITASGSTLSVVAGNLRITNDATGTNFGAASIPFTTVVGKNYRVVIARNGGSGLGLIHCGTTVVGTDLVANNQDGTFWFKATTTTTYVTLTVGGNTANGYYDYGSNSAKEWFAGNHALQDTSAARPEWSARVNLLTKSEQIGVAPWGVANVTLTQNAAIGSTGTANLTKVQATATGATQAAQGSIVVSAPTITQRWVARIGSGATDCNSFYLLNNTTAATLAYWTVDWTTGVVSHSVGSGATCVALGGGLWEIKHTQSTGITAGNALQIYAGFIGNSEISGEFAYLGEAQLEGGAFTKYQHVNTATDYDTVGFPFFLKFDGVDDGMSTATFAAGTLGADMDCFIAVRRATTGNFLLGYTTTGSSNVIGIGQAGNVSAADLGSGTPTYYVNGVALNGGATGTTRTQFEAAVPVGSWVIVEIRNANLSAWTAFATGAYTGFILGADVAQIVIAPAGDAAQRQLIRTSLGAPVGLTL